MKRVVVTITLIGLATLASAQENAAETIIQRSVEADAADWKAAPEYDHFERDQQPNGGTKTYEERMIMGSPYERLVEVNGKPLSPDRQAEEQSKLEAEISRRQNESQQDRAQRITRYEKDRKRNRLLMEQLAKAMDFVLVGEQKLEGRDVYVLKATPRPGYKPPNLETQMLRGMQGKLWIDKETFQWGRLKPRLYTRCRSKAFSRKCNQVHASNWKKHRSRTVSGFRSTCHEIAGQNTLPHPSPVTGG
jgi:hypothetical protein